MLLLQERGPEASVSLASRSLHGSPDQSISQLMAKQPLVGKLTPLSVALRAQGL